jgi:hypothetical protein
MQREVAPDAVAERWVWVKVAQEQRRKAVGI